VSFLYFAACQQHELNAQRATIAYAFDSPGGPSSQTTAGPNGRPGIVFGDAVGWQEREAQLGYFADRQQWTQMPASDVWVGWYDLPSPDHLVRPKTLRGHSTELSDGNHWVIPILRQLTPNGLECALPVQDSWDGSQWQPGTQPIAKYRYLWDASEQLTSPVEGANLYQLERNFCCMLLATNYRVSQVECGILALLTESDRVAMFGASIDMPTYEQILKKKRERDG
jgi:hypothetical protein